MLQSFLCVQFILMKMLFNFLLLYSEFSDNLNSDIQEQIIMTNILPCVKVNEIEIFMFLLGFYQVPSMYIYIYSVFCDMLTVVRNPKAKYLSEELFNFVLLHFVLF